jgi:hypothetical protein
LEQALELSGDNRPELEKVLSHYANKPLKLKATQFLIANMPGHVSYRNQAYVEQYYDEMDSVNLYNDHSEKKLIASYKAIADKYSKRSSPVHDLQVISAEYLIDNIERAFDDWQNGHWATHLSFEEFCEYLLPYKVSEYQSLDNWREYLSVPEYGDLQYLPYSAHSSHSAYWACYAVNQALFNLHPKEEEVVRVPVPFPIRRMRSLSYSFLKKECDDRSIAVMAVLRAKGIPAMMDFTPHWPNRNSGHAWNVILTNTGKSHHFHGLDTFENSHFDPPIAKVFRECYAINPELLELNLSRENVPAQFRNIHTLDVTDEYCRTDNISVNLNLRKGKYAYLSVFNFNQWKPVHYSKIKGKKAVFKKMGRDIVYLPLCMAAGQGLVPAGSPFILTLRGEIKPIVPDTARRQTLNLTRKYPTFKFTSKHANRVLGTEIQAANHVDFSDATTLHIIQKYGTEAGEILLDTVETKYRYWRYYSAPNGYCNVAELNFFTRDRDITKQGKIIGTPAEQQGYEKKHVFDGVPLTFFDSPDPSGSWVGLDFGEPVNISRIMYLPRTDGNMVYYGNEYELQYWDNNRWNSLGRKTSNNVYITFEDCPVGALFLLRNHTHGVEERIFTYENGKQVWW